MLYVIRYLSDSSPWRGTIGTYTSANITGNPVFTSSAGSSWFGVHVSFHRANHEPRHNTWRKWNCIG